MQLPLKLPAVPATAFHFSRFDNYFNDFHGEGRPDAEREFCLDKHLISVIPWAPVCAGSGWGRGRAKQHLEDS